MTPEQLWQIVAGLLTVVSVLIGWLWSRQHSWIRDHESRLKTIENDHLKRSEFDGAMNALRDQIGKSTQQLTEIETETRVRMEYMEKQMHKMEEAVLRVEVLITSGPRRKS